jgi:uncharacterized protein (TIGR01777 family)
MRLLLIGCTGLVGRELVPSLQAAGHQLTLVSRGAAPAAGFAGVAASALGWIRCNPAAAESWQPGSPLATALAAATGVVNLAGEPIAEQRWTAAHRQLLRTSRIDTTRHLVAAIGAAATPPQVLVNGSAVGFYGNCSEARFTEARPGANDFLGQLCQDWEAAAAALPASCRLVLVRTGIVLAPGGGALGKMLPIFRAGFGGPVGSGRQWMSWIHRTDLCALIAAALQDPAYGGIYNATAPQPVTMAAFSQALGRVLGRPSLLPVPGPLLQLLLGDGASVVLEGQRVLPEHLQQQGFSFRYPELAAALAAATSRVAR